MEKRKKVFLVAGTATALALGGGGLAYAGGAVGGDEKPEPAATGPGADRAGQVAVDSVGGGQVVTVVQENEGDVAYEVEVKKADGTVVEVEITKDFTVAPAENESGEGPETGTDGPETGTDGPEAPAATTPR